MKVSEYTLLEGAFDDSFGFMLNRLADLGFISVDPHAPEWKVAKEMAMDQCFTELVVALEEMGVELGEVDAPLKPKEKRNDWSL